MSWCDVQQALLLSGVAEGQDFLFGATSARAMEQQGAAARRLTKQEIKEILDKTEGVMPAERVMKNPKWLEQYLGYLHSVAIGKKTKAAKELNHFVGVERPTVCMEFLRTGGKAFYVPGLRFGTDEGAHRTTGSITLGRSGHEKRTVCTGTLATDSEVPCLPMRRVDRARLVAWHQVHQGGSPTRGPPPSHSHH